MIEHNEGLQFRDGSFAYFAFDAYNSPREAIDEAIKRTSVCEVCNEESTVLCNCGGDHD